MQKLQNKLRNFIFRSMKLLGWASRLCDIIGTSRLKLASISDCYYLDNDGVTYVITSWFQIHIDIPRMSPLIPLFQQKIVQEVSRSCGNWLPTVPCCCYCTEGLLRQMNWYPNTHLYINKLIRENSSGVVVNIYIGLEEISKMKNNIQVWSGNVITYQ